MSRLPVITLPTWLSACQDATSQRATAVLLGTSTTQGANASAYARRYTQLLAQKLSRLHTNSQYVRYYNPQADVSSFGYSGTVTNIDKGLSLRTKALAENATMTISPWCSAFTLHFVQGADCSPFALTVDGVGQEITPDTSRADDHYDGEYTITGLAYQAHTITVTAGAGGAKICGITVYDYANADPDVGIHFYNGGRGSLNTNNFVNQPEMYERIGSLSPQLIVMMFGTNDYGASMALATYRANLESIVASAKAAAPTADILMVHPFKRLDLTPSFPWASYGSVTRSVASANGAAYVDLTEYYPRSAAQDAANLIDSDNLHQTDAGHSQMARLLLPALV